MAPAKAGSLARPLNILMVGEESAGMQLVRTLARGPHRIVGVLTSPQSIPAEKLAAFGASHRTWDCLRFPPSASEDPALAEDIRAEESGCAFKRSLALHYSSRGAFGSFPGQLQSASRASSAVCRAELHELGTLPR